MGVNLQRKIQLISPTTATDKWPLGYIIFDEAKFENITIAATAPKAAPAETPMRPGSARGLRNNPCRDAPVMPNENPTMAANNTRGIRISKNTLKSSIFIFKMVQMGLFQLVLQESPQHCPMMNIKS